MKEIELGHWDDIDLKSVVNSVETHYYQADVVDNKFTIRSTLAEKWINERRNIIVLDNISGDRMLLTPFDLSIDAISDNVFKRSYQEGRFATLTLDWTPGLPVLPTTDLTKWCEALLKRFHFSFFNAMKPYLISEEFRAINNETNNLARKSKTIFPVKENVYRMFGYRMDLCKVCVIGRDSYNSVHANGIAFATDQLSKPVSLRTLEKAIQKDLNYPIEWQIQNNLLNVIKQGVYFFNIGLTAEFNKSGTYIDTWKPFAEQWIKAINNLPQPVIFLLLGSTARGYSHLIDFEKHQVLELSHLASSSYSGTEWDSQGVFKTINDSLEERQIPIIKW